MNYERERFVRRAGGDAWILIAGVAAASLLAFGCGVLAGFAWGWWK